MARRSFAPYLNSSFIHSTCYSMYKLFVQSILTKLCLLVLVIFTFQDTAFSQENKSFGHNVSHNTYIPQDNCTMGVQLVGCGWSDTQIVVGTSPFLLIWYNMFNLYLGKSFKTSETLEHAFQLSYFETYSDDIEEDPYYVDYRLNNDYRQQSTMFYYILGKEVSSFYKFYLNVSFYYYFKGSHPFSIRRPTLENRPSQYNLTTLHELHIDERNYFQLELGILHLRAIYPYVHSGASFVHSTKHWLFQFGVSVTSTFSSLTRASRDDREDYASILFERRKGYDGAVNRSNIKNDISIHPEMTIQYFF